MCIVMTLYSGNLLSVIAAAPGGKLTVPQTLEVCGALFGALAELHAAGIVHRVCVAAFVYIGAASWTAGSAGREAGKFAV